MKLNKYTYVMMVLCLIVFSFLIDAISSSAVIADGIAYETNPLLKTKTGFLEFFLHITSLIGMAILSVSILIQEFFLRKEYLREELYKFSFVGLFSTLTYHLIFLKVSAAVGNFSIYFGFGEWMITRIESIHYVGSDIFNVVSAFISIPLIRLFLLKRYAE